MGDMSMPDVRMVTHLHGAAVSESDPMDRAHNNDGWPDAWIRQGQEQIAEYPNPQTARTLWYHDHAMGETGRNVAAGLAGMYIIHDDYERSLNLPSGKYEIPLLIRSHGVNSDGTLYYTNDIGNEYYGNSDFGERKALAVRERRAAQVPLPIRERLERAQLRDETRGPGGSKLRSGVLSDRLGLRIPRKHGRC